VCIQCVHVCVCEKCSFVICMPQTQAQTQTHMTHTHIDTRCKPFLLCIFCVCKIKFFFSKKKKLSFKTMRVLFYFIWILYARLHKFINIEWNEPTECVPGHAATTEFRTNNCLRFNITLLSYYYYCIVSAYGVVSMFLFDENSL